MEFVSVGVVIVVIDFIKKQLEMVESMECRNRGPTPAPFPYSKPWLVARDRRRNIIHPLGLFDFSFVSCYQPGVDAELLRPCPVTKFLFLKD